MSAIQQLRNHLLSNAELAHLGDHELDEAGLRKKANEIHAATRDLTTHNVSLMEMYSLSVKQTKELHTELCQEIAEIASRIESIRAQDLIHSVVTTVCPPQLAPVEAQDKDSVFDPKWILEPRTVVQIVAKMPSWLSTIVKTAAENYREHLVEFGKVSQGIATLKQKYGHENVPNSLKLKVPEISHFPKNSLAYGDLKSKWLQVLGQAQMEMYSALLSAYETRLKELQSELQLRLSRSKVNRKVMEHMTMALSDCPENTELTRYCVWADSHFTECYYSVKASLEGDFRQKESKLAEKRIKFQQAKDSSMELDDSKTLKQQIHKELAPVLKDLQLLKNSLKREKPLPPRKDMKKPRQAPEKSKKALPANKRPNPSVGKKPVGNPPIKRKNGPVSKK